MVSMGQVVSHHWEPLDDLPPDWDFLASAELPALVDVWLEQKDLLAGSEALSQFNERLQRQWAIETGVIERIYTLDRGVTELLIERGIDASLIPHQTTDKDPHLVADMIRDHESAVDWLFDVVRNERPLSPFFVKELHALITRHQPTATARDQFGTEVQVPLLRGEWKQWPNNPTRADGSLHEFCPPEQVAPEMDRLVQLHLVHEDLRVPPEVEAAWLHHRFAQIHPFQDGNGRVARALASLVFIRAGWFPLVVTRDDRERYVDALEAGDKGDLEPLVNQFSALQRKAFVNALGVAREVLQRGERVDQVISSVRDLFASRGSGLRQEWGHAKLLADNVFQVARNRLEEVRSQLETEIGRFSPGFRFFVVAEPNGGHRSHWYRWQTFEIARQLDYFANIREYSSWVRLGLCTDVEANVVLALTAVGHEYRGLIGASLIFFRRAEVEGEDEGPANVAAASQELFQINYKEDESSVLDRFGGWLERGLLTALEMWRQGL
jgi:Fic family protein